MSNGTPLQTPGGFAPLYAAGFDDGTGHLAHVTASSPLPVHTVWPVTAQPLEGTLTGSATLGPYTPAPQAPIICTLSGDFSGSVRIMRSVDGGATLFPLTLGGAPWGEFAAPACEPVWAESEDGATLWLECSIASGTLGYRLAQ